MLINDGSYLWAERHDNAITAIDSVRAALSYIRGFVLGNCSNAHQKTNDVVYLDANQIALFVFSKYLGNKFVRSDLVQLIHDAAMTQRALTFIAYSQKNALWQAYEREYAMLDACANRIQYSQSNDDEIYQCLLDVMPLDTLPAPLNKIPQWKKIRQVWRIFFH